MSDGCESTSEAVVICTHTAMGSGSFGKLNCSLTMHSHPAVTKAHAAVCACTCGVCVYVWVKRCHFYFVSPQMRNNQAKRKDRHASAFFVYSLHICAAPFLLLSSSLVMCQMPLNRNCCLLPRTHLSSLSPALQVIKTSSRLCLSLSQGRSQRFNLRGPWGS